MALWQPRQLPVNPLCRAMDGNVSPSGQRSPRAVVHFQVELQLLVDVRIVCACVCVCVAGSRNYHVVRGRWTLPKPPPPPCGTVDRA